MLSSINCAHGRPGIIMDDGSIECGCSRFGNVTVGRLGLVGAAFHVKGMEFGMSHAAAVRLRDQLDAALQSHERQLQDVA